MNRAEWNRGYAVDRGCDAERRLVRRAMRQVDQHVLPTPPELVEIGEAQADQARDRRLQLRVSGRSPDNPAPSETPIRIGLARPPRAAKSTTTL